MGNFRVVLEAVGGHGCQRENTTGENVTGCQSMNCPDCITREYVQKMKDKGMNISEATLTHWPGQEDQVVDDMLTGKRSGSF